MVRQYTGTNFLSHNIVTRRLETRILEQHRCLDNAIAKLGYCTTHKQTMRERCMKTTEL
jgi:hypothetical protein